MPVTDTIEKLAENNESCNPIDDQEADRITKRIIEQIKGQSFIKVPLWSVFANDIAFRARFLPTQTKEDVHRFIDSILQRNDMRFILQKGTRIYRSRRIRSEKIRKDESGHFIGFDEKASGMPPYRKAPYGRVGTSGIPVFYTASDGKTSCAEIRPTKGDYISIAEYEVKEDMLLANFALDLLEKYDGTPDGNLYLNEMFLSFSMPVSSELIDYLPSEYISEYIRIKHPEIKGIRYSSLHNNGGYNMALFSEENCEFRGSYVVECTYVDYVFQSIREDD